MQLTNYRPAFLALIGLILVLSIDCEEQKHIESCSSLQSFTAFQSDLRFKFIRTGAKEPHVEEYRIKETFHQNKAKLEVESLDEKERKTFIFDYDKRLVFVRDLIADSCQSSQIEEDKEDFLGNFVFWDRETNVTGPTAIFNGLTKNSKLKKTGTTEIRGMDATRCFVQVREGGLLDRKTIKHELFIWNDFKSETEPLLKLTFSKISLTKKLSYEADYFSLRGLKADENPTNFDDELNDGFFFVPDHCVERREESHPPKEVIIPEKYSFTLHKIEREQSKTFSLIVDQENRLIELSGLRLNERSVLDLTHAAQYDLGRASCHKHFNGQYADLAEYGDLLEIMHKLKQLRASDYIGLRSCREMNCDAYSFYSSPDSLEDILRGEQNTGQKNEPKNEETNNAGNAAAAADVKQDVGPTLYTFYLRADDSTAFQHLVVQVKKQLFAAKGTNNNEPKQLMETTVYDVYDFKSLESDDPRSRPIDLTDCAYEEEHRNSIRMTASAEQTNQFQNDLRVERETVGKVKQITGLEEINFSKLEKLIDTNSVTVALTLIQPMNDLVYFETFDRYAIPLDNLKERFKQRTLEQCATLAKRNADWVGFQHCADSVCYALVDSSQFELVDVNNTEYEKQCSTMRKRADDSIGYVELPDAIDLIEKSIETGDFRLEDVGLTFQRLENEYEFNRIEKADYFRRVSDERCFNSEKLEDAVQCKRKRKLTDCILTCQSGNCNVFSVRRLAKDQFECCFAEPTLDDLEQQHGDELLVADDACSLYELSYLNKFNAFSGKTVSGRPEQSMLKSSPEDCAIACLKENAKNEFQCLSFSFCYSDGDYHCELRNYNLHSRTTAKLIDSNHCTLYSANFLIDYHKSNFDQLANFSVTADVSLQDCARHCQEKEQCSRFEFCQDKGNLACLLESNQTSNAKHPTDSVCTSYLKNKNLILDDLTAAEQNPPTKKAYGENANNSLYVLLVFFFILGLATGSLARCSRQLAFCGPRRRFCGKYYIKFVQEEDAISISERIEARKLSERPNQRRAEERLAVELERKPADAEQPIVSSPIQQSEQPAESENGASDTSDANDARSSSKTDDHRQTFGNENESGC